MNFYRKHIISVILFLGVVLKMQAIIIPLDLEHRMEASNQMVVAKLVSQTSYWDAAHTNIYTAHRLEVVSYLKEVGTNSFIELITLGGIVEGDAQLVFPEVRLIIGKEYFLFLDEMPLMPSSPLAPKARMQPNYYFQLYGHGQGLLPLEDGKYEDTYHNKKFLEADLLQRVYEVNNFQAITPHGTSFLARTHLNAARMPASQTLLLSNGLGQTTASFQAGTIDPDRELIINGTGFGTKIGSVRFPNSNDGGLSKRAITYSSDIIYWTDQEIRVKIPLSAGTGQMEVLNVNGQVIGSAPITIEWSVRSIYSDYRSFEEDTRQQAYLLDINDQGGYTIQLNSTSGFAADQLAVASLESALGHWQCASGVNWELDKTGTTAGFAKDDLCVIQYSTSLPSGVLGLATTRYKGVGSSRCNQENTLWTVGEFDIEVAPSDYLFPGFSWNFENASPGTFEFDFQSIILHELGHALGLGHVIDEEDVMHFSITNGKARRAIENKVAIAGEYIVESSVTKEHCINRTAMTRHPLDCSSIVEAPAIPISAHLKLFLEGFYDDSEGKMRTQLLDNNLLPTNQPYNSLFNYAGTEMMTADNTDIVDWVLIQLRAANDFEQVVHQKAALLRKDGYVLNEDGQEIIDFQLTDSASYYVAIYHKSHIPIISTTPIPFSRSPILYDFTLMETSVMGTNQLVNKQNVYLLSAGDFDGNGIVNNQDFNIWKQAGATLNAYSPADADGNGIINNQDYNLWKINSSKVSFLLR